MSHDALHVFAENTSGIRLHTEELTLGGKAVQSTVAAPINAMTSCKSQWFEAALPTLQNTRGMSWR